MLAAVPLVRLCKAARTEAAQAWTHPTENSNAPFQHIVRLSFSAVAQPCRCFAVLFERLMFSRARAKWGSPNMVSAPAAVEHHIKLGLHPLLQVEDRRGSSCRADGRVFLQLGPTLTRGV